MARKKDPFHGSDHRDADILLKLYELRREPEMRKARSQELEYRWALCDLLFGAPPIAVFVETPSPLSS